MSKIAGYLILALTVLLVLVLWTDAKKRKVAIPVTATNFLFAVFGVIAFAFINSDDVTELQIDKGITLHKAVSQAKIDIKTISELKTRVEGQSGIIDAVSSQALHAKEAAEKATENNIATQSALEAATIKLSELNTLVDEAGKQSFSLRQQAQISALILEAENDNRAAFDALAVKAADAFDPAQKEAASAYANVFNAHNQSFIGGISVKWNNGFEPQSAPFETLKNTYASLSSNLLQNMGTFNTISQNYHVAPFAQINSRAAIIQIVVNRADIDPAEKIGWILQIIQNETSLVDLEYASRAFDQLTGHSFAPLDTTSILAWWAENQGDWLKAHPPHQMNEKVAPVGDDPAHP